MNNRERLIALISDHALERMDVANMLLVKRETVDHWLMPPDSRTHEEVPEMAIELLEIKLGVKTVDSVKGR